MADGRLVAALQALDSLSAGFGPTTASASSPSTTRSRCPLAAGPVGDGQAARHALGSDLPGRDDQPLGRPPARNPGGPARRERRRAPPWSCSPTAMPTRASPTTPSSSVRDRRPARRGIATSTIGIGLGYDEDLLAAIVARRRGNAHFAEHGDEAGAALAPRSTACSSRPSRPPASPSGRPTT